MVAINSRLDMTDFFFINGKIKNLGDTHSNNTNAISVSYDRNEQLVGVWKAQTKLYDIPPSSTVAFTIPITDKTRSFRISIQTLLTESYNYSELKQYAYSCYVCFIVICSAIQQYVIAMAIHVLLIHVKPMFFGKLQFEKAQNQYGTKNAELKPLNSIVAHTSNKFFIIGR